MTVCKDLRRCSADDVLFILAQIIVRNSFLLWNKTQKFRWIFTVLTKAKKTYCPLHWKLKTDNNWMVIGFHDGISLESILKPDDQLQGHIQSQVTFLQNLFCVVVSVLRPTLAWTCRHLFILAIRMTLGDDVRNKSTFPGTRSSPVLLGCCCVWTGGEGGRSTPPC